jgi:hypothetical protein
VRKLEIPHVHREFQRIASSTPIVSDGATTLAGPASSLRDAFAPGLLVSRNVDVFGVLGGGAVLSLLLYLSWRSDLRGGAALALAGAAFAMLTDMPHVFQTTLRVGLDAQERRLHGRRYVISLILTVGIVGYFFTTGHRQVVLAVWIVWQFFHVIKQHYGIMRIYGAKARYRGPTRLAGATLFLGCVSPVLYRLGQGMRFGEYWVLGRRMPFSGLGLPAVPVPNGLLVAFYTAASACAIAFVYEQLSLRRSGQTILPRMSFGTITLAIVSYNLSYLLVSDLYALIMMATTLHSLQYHVISWRRCYGRFAREPGTDGSSLLEFLSRKGHAWFYAATVILVGATLASSETFLLGAVPLVLALQHFYLDGYMWRSALNPTLALDLGIARAGASPQRPVGASP